MLFNILMFYTLPLFFHEYILFLVIKSNVMYKIFKQILSHFQIWNIYKVLTVWLNFKVVHTTQPIYEYMVFTLEWTFYFKEKKKQPKKQIIHKDQATVALSSRNNRFFGTVVLHWLVQIIVLFFVQSISTFRQQKK